VGVRQFPTEALIFLSILHIVPPFIELILMGVLNGPSKSLASPFFSPLAVIENARLRNWIEGDYHLVPGSR
jgi:hypothetical protein